MVNRVIQIIVCEHRTKIPQSASRRHREKINATLEELGSLLPLPEDARSKLDKLTVLKLSVSYFQTQNYLQSGKFNCILEVLVYRCWLHPMIITGED